MTITHPKLTRRAGIWACSATQLQPDGKHLDLCFLAYSPREAWREYERYVTYYAGKK